MSDRPRDERDLLGAPEGESVPCGDGLVIGDELAAEILTGLEPLRFGEALAPEDREACFRLRYRAILETGMASAERFVDGREVDEYDERSVHILGLDGERPVATCRLVLPASDRLLPAEKEYGLRLSTRGALVELGRLVVDPAYRGDGHSVFMGLAAQAWRSMRARGFTTALGTTSRRLIALFDALGFRVTTLGPPRDYWGEPRYPILCEGAAAIPGISRSWSETPGAGAPGDDPSQ